MKKQTAKEPESVDQNKFILIKSGMMIRVELLTEKPKYMYPGQTLYRVIPEL
jgi:hypothetical protein